MSTRNQQLTKALERRQLIEVDEFKSGLRAIVQRGAAHRASDDAEPHGMINRKPLAKLFFSGGGVLVGPQGDLNHLARCRMVNTWGFSAARGRNGRAACSLIAQCGRANEM